MISKNTNTSSPFFTLSILKSIEYKWLWWSCFFFTFSILPAQITIKSDADFYISKSIDFYSSESIEILEKNKEDIVLDISSDIKFINPEQVHVVKKHVKKNKILIAPSTEQKPSKTKNYKSPNLRKIKVSDYNSSNYSSFFVLGKITSITSPSTDKCKAFNPSYGISLFYPVKKITIPYQNKQNFLNQLPSKPSRAPPHF